MLEIGPNLLAAITLLVVTFNAAFSVYLLRSNSSEHTALKAQIEATNGGPNDHRAG